ncbi:hypothetical protein BGX24_010644 [Mortierella sp. AD032]|nr:hypothetical protein BGX24_010644 [Mortierella sp. AD032]
MTTSTSAPGLSQSSHSPAFTISSTSERNMKFSQTETVVPREKKQGRSTGFSWVHFIAGGRDGGRTGDFAAGRGYSRRSTRMLSALAQGQYIYTTEGPRALYKGLGPNLVGVIPARAISFAAYGNGKKFFAELNHGKETALVHLAAAANAGVVTSTTTNPIWMVKTRMQLQSEGNKRIYRNSLHCTMEILRTEGLGGLYKGLSASYLGVAEGTIQWVVYEHLKSRFAERRRADQISLALETGSFSSQNSNGTLVGGKRVEEWVDYLGAAGIAKFIASAITYPHEVLRTRMRQTPAKGESVRYTGLRQTFGLILREEGVGALYGGLTAHMMRVVPNAAIMFFCYEAILHRFS